MNPIMIVTGGNRGIGLALVKQLAERSETVIATCREPSDELVAAAKKSRHIEVETGVDMRDLQSLQRFASKVAFNVGWLIHNAGVLSAEGLDHLDVEAARHQFEVNALAPLVLTQALAKRLGRGSKIGIVTSLMGSLKDNASGGYYGYRMSKAAVNMAGVSLAHDLRSKGVAVALLHPGYVRTRMTGGGGNIDADTSASGLIARLDALTLETSGRFWHQDGRELPW